MSNSSQVTKESIVRAVLELLPKVSAPAVDVGELVLFLEREADSWIQGSVVDLRPLWAYCRDKSGWQEDFFRRLSDALQERFAEADVEWNSPFGQTNAADFAEDFAEVEENQSAAGSEATAASSATGDDGALVDWLLDGVRRSPVEKIIDPEKLRGFLHDAMEEMHQDGALDLQLLWEVVLDADGVDEQMLIKAFLVMQVEHHNRKMSVEVRWPTLVAGLPQKMRETLLESMGLEEREEVDYSNAYAITSQRDAKPGGEGSSGRSTGSRPAPSSKSDKQERARKARVGSGPMIVDQQSTTLPAWLLYALIAVVVGSGLFYFFFLREPTPAWTGKLIDSTPYSKIMSFEAIRIRKGTVNVKATKKFMSLPETRRGEKAYALWIAIRKNHRIYRLVVFSPDGKPQHTYESQ